MSEPTLYDRVRAWTDNVGVTDPMKELCCMVEEMGEVDEADGAQDRAALADALGDVAVCLISNDYLLRNRKGPFIEDFMVIEYAVAARLSNMSVLGRIAEGIRKPAKRDQAFKYQSIALDRIKQYAKYHGLDFERDCLGLVVPIIESRVAGGKLVNGTFVKAGDL